MWFRQESCVCAGFHHRNVVKCTRLMRKCDAKQTLCGISRSKWVWNQHWINSADMKYEISCDPGITVELFLCFVLSQFKMYNATFSQVEIWFRFVFVVMTFIVTVSYRHRRSAGFECFMSVWWWCCVCVQCMFAHSLRKFSMRDWGIEQKWMSILLPLLLLYNGETHTSLPLHHNWIIKN